MKNENSSNQTPLGGIKKYAFHFSVALIIPFLHLALSHNLAINIADEGYLWNGALSLADGMIPIRDFASYDPFRYFYCAIFVFVFGRGILSVRIAMALFQVAATFGILVLLDRYASRKYNKLLLIILSISILMWFGSNHKSIDIAMPVFSIIALVYLLNSESKHRFFATGIFVGFSAFVGSNHGYYNLFIFGASVLFSLIFAERARPVKKLFSFSAGVVAGYSPTLAMMALVPGFFRQYLARVIAIFVNVADPDKSTNIPLPIPWPWTVDFSQGPAIANLVSFLSGMFFLIAPIVYVCALVLFIRRTIKKQQANTAVFAAAIVGLVYCHYAFSRADTGHIAHSIMPFILIICLWASAQRRYKLLQPMIIVLIFLYSFGTIGQTTNRLYNHYRGFYPYSIQIGRDMETIHMDKASHDLIAAIREIKADFRIEDREIFFAPYLPGMYPIMDVHSPTYSAYFLNKTTTKRQKTTIREMQQNHVKYIVYSDQFIDGNEDLAFYNSNPLVYDYIIANYDLCESALPDGYKLRVLKSENIR
jgi:hypothetical protein